VTWDRPSLLALAALAALLPWLLGRLRERRARVVTGSLLLYERALEILAARGASAAAQSERRRALDARTIAETVALVALALAAARPRLEGTAPARRAGVVLDDSPSMRAAGRGDLSGLASRLGPRDAVTTARTSEAPPAATDPIAWATAALRAQGVDAVLAVTDHAVGTSRAAGSSSSEETGARPDAVYVSAGEGRVNRGIVAAGITGREVLVRSDAADARLAVRDDGGQVLLEGVGRELRGLLPEGATASALWCEVVGPLEAGPEGLAEAYADALALDDRVRLEPPGAPVRVAIRGPRDERLLEAIEAAGGDAEGDVLAEATVVLASAADRGAPRPASLRAIPTPWLRHADLASIDVRAAPVPLGAEGRPLLVDDRGRAILSTRGLPRPTTLVIHVPLEETDWPGRRSFPVLVAEWLDAVAGPARDEWRALGLLSARETAEAGPPAAGPEGGLSPDARVDAALAALERAAERSPRLAEAARASSTPLERPLAAAGALAALTAWAFTRDRRAGAALAASAAQAPSSTTSSRRDSSCVVS